MQWAWHGVQDGEVLEFGRIRMSQDEIVAFAKVYDPQPVHIDDDAARKTLLGGLVASGWHTCTVIMELLQTAMASRVPEMAVAGAEEIVWMKPVRPGDTLQGFVTWTTSPPCTCGTVARKAKVEVHNQAGAVVMRWSLDCTFPVGPSNHDAASQSCTLRRGRAARVTRHPRSNAIRYFDEVMPGDEIELGDYTFADEDVAAFQSRYCPRSDTEQSGNLDARPPGTSRQVVPPWQITAAWMQCMVRYYERESARLADLGRTAPLLGPAAGVRHLRWHAPIMSGETITFRGWAERKLEIASQPKWGLLVVGAEGVNMAGDTVVSFYPQMLLERDVKMG